MVYGAALTLMACERTPADRLARLRADAAQSCGPYDHARATGEWGQLLPGDITYCQFVRAQIDSATRR